jgi:hypothetical protein
LIFFASPGFLSPFHHFFISPRADSQAGFLAFDAELMISLYRHFFRQPFSPLFRRRLRLLSLHARRHAAELFASFSRRLASTPRC